MYIKFAKFDLLHNCTMQMMLQDSIMIMCPTSQVVARRDQALSRGWWVMEQRHRIWQLRHLLASCDGWSQCSYCRNNCFHFRSHTLHTSTTSLYGPSRLKINKIIVNYWYDGVERDGCGYQSRMFSVTFPEKVEPRQCSIKYKYYYSAVISRGQLASLRGMFPASHQLHSRNTQHSTSRDIRRYADFPRRQARTYPDNCSRLALTILFSLV